MLPGPDYIRWFDAIGLEDVPLVGGKNASLGEMYRHLRDSGVLVPNGFALTSAAYRDALTRAGSWERLRALLGTLDPTDLGRLAECSAAARYLVYDAAGSTELRDATAVAYRRLEQDYGANVSVAVRSSATAEDLPEASFAGQHESFLAVQGEDAVFDACRRCFASLFLERAIVYRANNGFDHFKVALSVGVMKMVRSDQAASGVIFTLDTESGFRDVVFVTGAYGLGENIVQGRVDPDEFYVHKPTFRDGRRAVLRRSLGQKQFAMRLGPGDGAARVRNEPTDPALRQRFCIRDEDVLALADYALRIEDHYSARAGHPMPMDIEWAQDGPDGALYVVQARPETVASRKSPAAFETYTLRSDVAPIVRGKAVGEKIGSGAVRLIRGEADLRDFRPGEVLVAPTTSPDWEPVMKTAAGIVTDHGGRTCHAAIIARELGIPAVVGTETASSVLQPDARVTVSCAGGETGAVYLGDLSYEVAHVDMSRLASPKTAVMVNLGNPDLAFRTALTPNQGVGLARMEFVISEHIGIHPMALLHPERIGGSDQLRIRERSTADPSPVEFFVRELAEGVGTIAAAFYPKPVIVRLSDFKTNEYAALIGGAVFEPVEANPMLGFRGASRYAHPAYAEGFALECAALRRVRGEMGLTNLVVMVPFCRRIGEAEKVLSEMARNGLRRGVNGLEVYVMCEIPNNVISADNFAKLFDGFSIGSNDLTQLTLGVDRDPEIVAFDFDERDPGMLEMLHLAIAAAHRNGRKVGICGEAPASYPEIARYLVSLGIDSISVNPSSVIRTITVVNEAEAELHRNQRMRA